MVGVGGVGATNVYMLDWLMTTWVDFGLGVGEECVTMEVNK